MKQKEWLVVAIHNITEIQKSLEANTNICQPSYSYAWRVFLSIIPVYAFLVLTYSCFLFDIGG